MQHKKWWSLGIVMLFMAMFALTGCGGGGEAALVGTWKVDTSAMPASPAGSPATAENMKKLADSMTLTLNADKTFAMNMIFQFGGDWTYADNTLTLNTTKMGNLDISKMPGANAAQKKPMTLTLSSDNAHLTMQSPTGQATASTLTFVKS